MNKLEWAKKYKSRGFSIIPIRPKGKTPAIKWTEYQNRYASVEELEEWFGNGSKNNIGIVTGKISGISVVDLDSQEAVRFAKDNNFPQTPLAKTGKGYHLYYQHKDSIRNFQKKDDLPGIDLRAEGGYVVAPPSLHESGRQYRWVDGKGIDDIPYGELPEIVLAKDSRAKKPLRELYKGTRKGDRNDTLARLAGSWISNGLTFDECLENARIWNLKNKPPLPEKEVEGVVRSIFKKHEQKKTDDDNIWQDPIPCDTHDFPKLNQEALYGLAGDVVKAIEPETEADKVALLTNFLTAFGNVIGDKPHFIADGSRHPMRLFVVHVGETSKGRKGTAWSRIFQLFKSVEPEWTADHITGGLSSGEGLIWVVRDPIEKKEPVREKKLIKDYQTVVVDHGVEDKRLLVVEQEFASVLRVLSREGNILSAVIRQAWDTGNLNTLTKNSSAKATSAHISILGHITKDELIRYLDRTESGNGFGNRFLWLCVRRSKCLPEGGGDVNFNPFVERLHKSVEFSRDAGEIKKDDDTRTVWHGVYPALSEGKPGLFGALTSRAEAQVMRLACIYALLDCSNIIKKEHLAAALGLWEYCKSSVKFIFGEATGDYVADQILLAVKDNEQGLSRNDIYRRLLCGNVKRERIDKALTLLFSRNLIRREKKATNGRHVEKILSV